MLDFVDVGCCWCCWCWMLLVEGVADAAGISTKYCYLIFVLCLMMSFCEVLLPWLLLLLLLPLLLHCCCICGCCYQYSSILTITSKGFINNSSHIDDVLIFQSCWQFGSKLCRPLRCGDIVFSRRIKSFPSNWLITNLAEFECKFHVRLPRAVCWLDYTRHPILNESIYVTRAWSDIGGWGSSFSNEEALQLLLEKKMGWKREEEPENGGPQLIIWWIS